MNKLIDYIKSSVIEMKKVTWPSRKETYRYTILVVVISLATAAFLGALDFVFNYGFQLVI